MRGKPVNVEQCGCGAYAQRMEEGRALWLKCGGCGKETAKTELRTEAALDALANEWNAAKPLQ